MKIKQFLPETTCSGSIGSVASPSGKTQKRAGSLFRGKKTNKPFVEGKMKALDIDLKELSDVAFKKKYGKSKQEMRDTLKEADLSEQDKIVTPGKGNRFAPGLLSRPDSSVNPRDVVKLDIPLLIRLLEYAREDAKTDMDLHDLTEKLIARGARGRTLTMKDYSEVTESTGGVIAGGGVGESLEYDDEIEKKYQQYINNGALNSRKGKAIQQEAERYAANMGEAAVHYYFVQRVFYDMSKGQAEVLTARTFGRNNVTEEPTSPPVATQPGGWRRTDMRESGNAEKPKKYTGEELDLMVSFLANQLGMSPKLVRNQYVDPMLQRGEIILVDDTVDEGYKVVPNIDSERYPKRPGLEGPFRTKNTGKVVYYDPKEGKYYDPDSDMYLDHGLDNEVGEGVAGAVVGGMAGAELTGSPQGVMTGAKIGSKVQDFAKDMGVLDETAKRSVDHSRIYKMINRLALESIEGLTPQLAYSATMEANNDMFWDHSIDNVTSILEKHINDPSLMSYEEPINSVEEAVKNVALNIISYYDNAMNFEPSRFKKYNLSFNPRKVLTDQRILREIYNITGVDVSDGNLNLKKKATREELLLPPKKSEVSVKRESSIMKGIQSESNRIPR